MLLNNLSELEAYQVLRALLAAKFTSTNSVEFMGIEIINSLIKEVLERDFKNINLNMVIKSYSSLEVGAEYFRATIGALRIMRNSGFNISQEPTISDTIRGMCFPYPVSKKLCDELLALSAMEDDDLGLE